MNKVSKKQVNLSPPGTKFYHAKEADEIIKHLERRLYLWQRGHNAIGTDYQHKQLIKLINQDKSND